MKKYIIGGIALVVIAGAMWWAMKPTVAPFTAVIENDTVITGDYTVPKGQRMTVRNGAKMTVQGNVEIAGSLACEQGPLLLVVQGNANIAGSLTCSRGEGSLTQDDLGLGIALVVKGDLEFKAESVIETNGSLQITDDEAELALTPEKIRYWYEDAEDDTGKGEHVGPLVSTRPGFKLPFVQPVYAAAIVQGHRVFLGGNFKVALPPVKVPQVPRGAGGAEPLLRDFLLHPPEQQQIVLFRFPHARELIINDLTIEGPEGRAGIDDIERSCMAHGGDGKDAYRFTMWAPSIIVQGIFNLKLGSGGRGGDASTKRNCDPGVALGGRGGQPGNFKITWENKFEFRGDKGQFVIQPGAGGRGGNAFAYGRPGGPGQKGGDARAKGGDGAHNEKRASANLGKHLRVKILQTVVGGKAGNAVAYAGEGGDEPQCGRKGGDGGNAVAKAGNAGKGLDQGGLGGDADSKAGFAGRGGDCPPQPPQKGGNGGKGGNAVAVPSRGGSGKAFGTDGSMLQEAAGAGGVGGEGCPEGKGGKAGTGKKEPASDGLDGKNNCKNPPVEPPKDEIFSAMCEPKEIRAPHGKEITFAIVTGSKKSAAIDHITVQGKKLGEELTNSKGTLKILPGNKVSYRGTLHDADPVEQTETFEVEVYSANGTKLRTTCTAIITHTAKRITTPTGGSSGGTGGGGTGGSTGSGGGSGTGSGTTVPPDQNKADKGAYEYVQSTATLNVILAGVVANLQINGVQIDPQEQNPPLSAISSVSMGINGTPMERYTSSTTGWGGDRVRGLFNGPVVLDGTKQSIFALSFAQDILDNLPSVLLVNLLRDGQLVKTLNVPLTIAVQ